MTLTTIQVFQKAVDVGLRLGVESPGTLTFQPANRCSKDFLPVLKAHKPALLELLRLSFVMVFSQILGETIFFCDCGETRAALVEAGAEPANIYTRAELQVLVAHHRAKPFMPDELLRFHEVRRTFNARFRE